MRIRALILAIPALLLVACAGDEKPQEDRDGAPDRQLSPSQVNDAVPRPEPRARYGNKKVYEVWGSPTR